MQCWFRRAARIEERVAASASASASVRSQSGLARAIVGVVIAVALTSFGCDSGSLLPPENPELRGEAGATQVAVTDSTLARTVSDLAPQPARPIELILNQHDPDYLEVLKTSARTQAGLDKFKLKISVLGADGAPAKQSEIIREALTHHPRALVIEPADLNDPELAKSVDAAEAQGISVVMVGHPLPGAKKAADTAAAKGSASAGARGSVVALEPHFAESAKQMVAAAIRIAQVSELQISGGAMLVIKEGNDPFVAERDQAIKDALKAAGITLVEEVKMLADVKASEKLLSERIKANSKVVLIFAVDSVSANAMREALSADIDNRLLIAAAYTTDDQFNTIGRIPNVAAVAEFTPTRIIRRALTTANNLAQGKETPAIVDFRVNVIESPVNSNVLRNPKVPSPDKAYQNFEAQNKKKKP